MAILCWAAKRSLRGTVELFEKWQNCTPPPPSGASLWWSVLGTQFGVSPRVGVANSRCHGGGGVAAWVVLSGAFPQTQGISFLAISPLLHYIWPFFLMVFPPIKTALLLILF
jgi:hypothetical protein